MVSQAQRRCAVVGSPIEHSLSPVLHRAAYDAVGLDWTYDAYRAGRAGPAGVRERSRPDVAGAVADDAVETHGDPAARRGHRTRAAGVRRQHADHRRGSAGRPQHRHPGSGRPRSASGSPVRCTPRSSSAVARPRPRRCWRWRTSAAVRCRWWFAIRRGRRRRCPRPAGTRLTRWSRCVTSGGCAAGRRHPGLHDPGGCPGSARAADCREGRRSVRRALRPLAHAAGGVRRARGADPCRRARPAAAPGVRPVHVDDRHHRAAARGDADRR